MEVGEVGIQRNAIKEWLRIDEGRELLRNSNNAGIVCKHQAGPTLTIIPAGPVSFPDAGWRKYPDDTEDYSRVEIAR